MPLTSRQIRYLRGLTHHLQPVVMVGDKGLSENVLMEGQHNGCYDVEKHPGGQAELPDSPCQYWVNKLIWMKL